MAEPLEGPIPVGRWRCYYDQDLERFRNTNSTSLLRNDCNVLDFKRDFEFNPDGTGWVLDRYVAGNSSIPSEAFRISGSSLIYARKREFRWALNSRHLTIQTTRNLVSTITMVNDSTFRYEWESHSRGSQVFVLIGSPAHKRMAEFRACAEKNNGRNLFEVVDCGEPPDTGRE